MKKIAFALICLAFIGCTKEEPLAPKKDCNCGIITNDNHYLDANLNSVYTLEVRNDCSQVTKVFYVSKGDWMNNHAGDKTCFDNLSSW
jgi:hypothetical protein